MQYTYEIDPLGDTFLFLLHGDPNETDTEAKLDTHTQYINARRPNRKGNYH